MHALSCTVELPIDVTLAYDAWTCGWGLWLASPDSVHLTRRVGAAFAFDVVVPGAAGAPDRRYPHYGRFRTLTPPSSVQFTWVSGPSGTGGVETLVTVALEAVDAAVTRCTLRHEGFATAESCDRHASAWSGMLAAQAERLRHVTPAAWAEVRQRFGGLPVNRSVPDSTFIPTRSYPDLDAAVRWLVEVLGCSERLRLPGERVQLTLGNGAVVVAAWDANQAPASGGRPPATLVVRVPDVDAAWHRAMERGFAPLTTPMTGADGERQAVVRDPAGHAWALSQSMADVDPTAWGAHLPR
jgi:uncharacterized glyoxalase superfamily protein PhnB